MIVDLLTNVHLYQGLSSRTDRAFEYLRQTDLAALETGDQAIDGTNIYARVLTYTTRLMEQGVWEAIAAISTYRSLSREQSAFATRR
jgi:YhcH/YjgK/YiaL family protein